MRCTAVCSSGVGRTGCKHKGINYYYIILVKSYISGLRSYYFMCPYTVQIHKPFLIGYTVRRRLKSPGETLKVWWIFNDQELIATTMFMCNSSLSVIHLPKHFTECYLGGLGAKAYQQCMQCLFMSHCLGDGKNSNGTSLILQVLNYRNSDIFIDNGKMATATWVIGWLHLGPKEV